MAHFFRKRCGHGNGAVGRVVQTTIRIVNHRTAVVTQIRGLSSVRSIAFPRTSRAHAG